MISSDLWHLAARYVPNFIGVYPLDKLPYIRKYPTSFIINTHTHNLPGEHWIAVHIDKYGVIHAFDSFGHYYPWLLRQYLEQRSRGRKVKYNSIIFQESSEKTCGLYCVAWLIDISLK